MTRRNVIFQAGSSNVCDAAVPGATLTAWPYWQPGDLLKVCLLALAILTCVSVASAQSGAGSIEGRVTDKTGAIIPGATVHVVNNATSVATDAKANNSGIYQVPELFAGQYTVTVTAQGMGSFQTNLELLVDQHAVINASLATGSVNTQVEVTADTAQLINTENGTIAYDLDSKRIDQLPQNGRLLLNEVIGTTPGLEPKGTGALMVNGLESESMEWVADGVPLSNRQFGGVNQTQGQLPDPDAVSEVRIETTDVGAKYATPGVAIINTKSGTNAIHGSFFETIRNNAVGIARNRNNLAAFIAPHLVRNEFGGSAGGPVIIPHFYNGKDKTFWFFAFERYSLSQNQSEQVYVPADAWRTGDFSGLLSLGTPIQLYDPATTHNDTNCNGSGKSNPYCRTPFANNQIPVGRLSPTSKILYDITPHPSSANLPQTGPNLSANNPMYTVIPNYSTRLDHYFNENNRAYLRFTGIQQTSDSLRNNPNSPVTVAADGLPYAASGLTVTPTTTYAGALGFTHIISPSFFSETVVSQQWFAQHNFAGGCPTCNFEKQLGLPNNFGNTGFPLIGSGNLAANNGGYSGTQYIYGLSQIIWNVDENLTKTLGRHKLEFGGRYRLERFNDLPDQSADTVNFNGQGTGLINPASLPAATSKPTYTATPNTGASDADFFLGNVANYGVRQLPSYFQAHDMEIDGYFQDTIRVTQKLTVGVGLRWEDHPSALVQNGLFTGFDFKNDALVLGAPLTTLLAKGYTNQTLITSLQSLGVKFETSQGSGFPSTLMRNYPENFLPRVSFAFQPNGDHGAVLRGGYGRYLYPIPTRSYLKSPVQNTPFTSSYTQDFTNPAQTPDGLPNAQLRFPQGSGAWSQTSPFLPVLGVNSANNVNSSAVSGVLPGISLVTDSLNLAPDAVTNANFTFEQPFKSNQALRLSYVYSHGSNLDHYYYPNNSPSAFVYELATGNAPNTANGSIATRPYDNTTWGNNVDVQKNGWSNYNALQANYEKRARKGVAYQISYTWAKAFRIGGNSFRDSSTYPYANYQNAAGVAPGVSLNTTGTTNFVAGGQIALAPTLPPPPPSGTPIWGSYHALMRFENYVVDTNVPEHHVRFNAVVDLPFGRNKRFLGKASRWEDELVGGWQVAAIGQVVSQAFFVGNSNWGAVNPLQSYKHGMNITDCQTGICQRAKLWFNGFILPSAGAMGKITGLPSGYQVGSAASPAYSSPINFAYTTTPGTIQATNNNVNVVTPNGTIPNVTYSPGPSTVNPFSRTELRGPYNYNADISLYKVFPIREGMFLRVNFDAFNAFNIQGYNNPSTTSGIIDLGANGQTNSYWTPRQVQISARFTF